MLEQVVNAKKRYRKLVQQFGREDFVEYFAEFFALHQCVTAVKWIQEQDTGTFLIRGIQFKLTPGYIRSHSNLWDMLQDTWWVPTWKIDKHYRVSDVELYEAVREIEKLCEGGDVFEHVFGLDVDIAVTPESLTVTKWGEDAESTDSHQSKSDH